MAMVLQSNGADPHQQPVGPPPPPVQQAQPVQNPSPSLHCIRQGCPNPAIVNSEWEDEYCSNECVVSHCRCVKQTLKPMGNIQYGNFTQVFEPQIISFNY